MKYLLILVCAISICYPIGETKYSEAVISVTHILCDLYDKEGVKASSPDETKSKKRGTDRIIPMATGETILLQLYGQTPFYLQTEDALFELPTRTGRTRIENFAEKFFAELEKGWIITLTDKTSFRSCIPPYNRPVYRLDKR